MNSETLPNFFKRPICNSSHLVLHSGIHCGSGGFLQLYVEFFFYQLLRFDNINFYLVSRLLRKYEYFIGTLCIVLLDIQLSLWLPSKQLI